MKRAGPESCPRRCQSLFLHLALGLGLLATTPSPVRAEPGRSFIWEIKTNGGSSYVLGSMHLAKKELYPLPRAMEQAFSRAQVVVLEARVDEVARVLPTVMQEATYQPPDALDQHLSPATLKRLRQRLENLPLPEAILFRLKPWVVAMMLQALEMKRLGYDENAGIDMYFLGKAKQQKKELAELESVEFQVKLLSGMPEKTQEQFLLYTIAEIDQLGQQLAAITTAWRAGAPDALHRLLVAEIAKHPRHRSMYRKLITDRNVGMAKGMERLLRSGRSHLFIVGAGHLVGPEGILKKLAASGFRLRQL